MKMTRGKFLKLLGALFALPVVAKELASEEYPHGIMGYIREHGHKIKPMNSIPMNDKLLEMMKNDPVLFSNVFLPEHTSIAYRGIGKQRLVNAMHQKIINREVKALKMKAFYSGDKW